jgi:hypothetical protein
VSGFNEIIVEIENSQQERVDLESKIATCNTEQRHCFNAAQACISGADKRQLVMFVSGEGGTGKSFLIHALTKYTQILYGKTEGWFGSVLKSAPTGAAAHNIRGHTWHSALGKTTFQRLTKKGKLSDKQVASLQKNLKGVKLFILDEISLLSLEDLYEISFRLCTATGKKCLLFVLFVFYLCVGCFVFVFWKCLLSVYTIFLCFVQVILRNHLVEFTLYWLVISIK